MARRGAQALRREGHPPRPPGLLRLGSFDSYARGDWGVGSDLDPIAIVDGSTLPFERRLEWQTSTLPMPAERPVYTRDEWERLATAAGRFYRTVNREAAWLLGRRG